ncbi:hypothetical protein [Streptomyces sp. NPDC058326]|uniref:hypothetical protein n=1 Tax=Streptomyces sp. NPDC058326 TaxID=3346447 RepID=UPI0036EB8175
MESSSAFGAAASVGRAGDLLELRPLGGEEDPASAMRIQRAPGVYELTWSRGTGPTGRA